MRELLDKAFEIGMIQNRWEIESLINFLSEEKLGNVMEIGTDQGGTFFLLCQIATGKKISLDLPGGPWSSRGANEEKLQSFSENIYLIRANSHEETTKQQVKKILNGETLDLLFIDGDHSYEGVKQDYEMYSEFVNHGGYIIFHDIKNTDHHKNYGVEVWKLWNELPNRQITFSDTTNWGGIGVVRKNDYRYTNKF